MHGACEKPVTPDLVPIIVRGVERQVSKMLRSRRVTVMHTNINTHAKCGFPGAYCEKPTDIHGLNQVLEIMWKKLSVGRLNSLPRM